VAAHTAPRIGYGLDESERVVGAGIAAVRDLLAEMSLYRRQTVVVPLLSLGDYLCSCVARGSIGGVAGGFGLDAEASLVQPGVGIDYRLYNKAIGAR
jgi:hypothetical protein